jgi:hypothetical protein
VQLFGPSYSAFGRIGGDTDVGDVGYQRVLEVRARPGLKLQASIADEDGIEAVVEAVEL